MNSALNLFLLFTVFTTAACLGSFFKVLIDRYGTNESFINRPSRCSSCKKNLYWWHNIPIVSFFILGGKCFFCKEKIDINCLYSEIASSSIALITFYSTYVKTSDYAISMLSAMFILILVLLSMYDLKHRIIPHQITYSAIVLIIFSRYFFYHVPLLISFANSGIAFLAMDFIYLISTSMKRFKFDLSPIAIPLLVWSAYFALFSNFNFYILILIAISSVLLTKIKINNKITLISWIAFMIVVSLLIYKLLIKENDFATLSAFLSGVGITYFIAEIIMYFISLVTDKMVMAKSTEEQQITIGGGDITTFVLIAVFLGYKAAFLSLFIASLLAILSHFILKVTYGPYKNKKQQFIPFVPFISLACFIIMITIHGN